MTPPLSATSRAWVFLWITAASLLGFAATDLVLPAVPGLPQALGGTAAQAQFMLAAFVAGFAAGLLAWGELGARGPLRLLLAASLAGFALTSWAAARSGSIEALIAWRLPQGVSAAAAAGYAPALLRQVFGERDALRAIGWQGSLEALAPALAPVAGVWLLAWGGWRASFDTLALLAVCVLALLPALPRAAFDVPQRAAGSYRRLLVNGRFLRLGLAHACTLGGLLVVVFGAPAVLVGSLGGGLGDFIRMQMLGVASFIAAANFSPMLCRRFGHAAVTFAGSLLSALGCVGLLALALAGFATPWTVACAFVMVNLGLGVRGPCGFLDAIVAAQDDARGAALAILAILVVTALGTAGVAPWIRQGLLPLAATACAISAGSVLLLLWEARILRTRAGA